MFSIEPREKDDLNQLEDEAFRLHIRSWIEANYPAEIRNPPKRLHWEDNKVWYFKLAEKGWLCPSWPRQYGGLGLSPAKQIIFTEELERGHCLYAIAYQDGKPDEILFAGYSYD